MSVARLDGRALAPGQGVPLDDPLVRAGDALVETMRARNGVVAWRGRHLDRMEASAAALMLDVLPRAEWERELDALLAVAGSGDLRVRLCVSARPTVWVEAVPVAPGSRPPARAVALRKLWLPGDGVAEHKTASRARWAWAERRAGAAGADTALLLDADGRLGEGTVANAFAWRDGVWWTAPAQGLLPGVGRAVLMGAVAVREEALPEEAWRGAQEIALVSASAGVRPVTEVDGAPVGDGAPGPRAAALAAAHAELLAQAVGDR